MVWEFPAVSQTRLPFWKQPQYTRNGMFWFTVVFGALGLHHLLLRSPQTWILFLVFNTLSFGYLFFYDLIQLSSYGEFPTTEELNKYGLQSPYANLGLAQGMWTEKPPGGSDSPAGAAAKDLPPSPWLQVLYVLALPIAPLALLIAGDHWNAFGRFLNWLSPIGWVIGAFAFCADYFTLFAKPSELYMLGASRYFPFTIIQDNNGHSPFLTGKYEFKKCPRENYLDTLMKYSMLAIPIIELVSPSTGKTIRAGIAASQTAVQTTKLAVNTGTKAVGAVSEIATTVPKAAQQTLGVAQQIVSNPSAAVAAQAAQAAQVAVKPPQASLPVQTGGARTISEAATPLDVLALSAVGAVIGGGFLLAASRAFQNGRSQPEDSPPDPRAVRSASEP